MAEYPLHNPDLSYLRVSGFSRAVARRLSPPDPLAVQSWKANICAFPRHKEILATAYSGALNWVQEAGYLLDHLEDYQMPDSVRVDFETQLKLIQHDWNNSPLSDIYKANALVKIIRGLKGGQPIVESLWSASLSAFLLGVHSGWFQEDRPLNKYPNFVFVNPRLEVDKQQATRFRQEACLIAPAQFRAGERVLEIVPHDVQKMYADVMPRVFYDEYGFRPSEDHLFALNSGLPFVMAPFDRFIRWGKEDLRQKATINRGFFQDNILFRTSEEYGPHDYAKFQVPPVYIAWYSRYPENDYMSYLRGLVGKVVIDDRDATLEEIIDLKSLHERVHGYINPIVGSAYDGSNHNWLTEGLVGCIADIPIHKAALSCLTGQDHKAEEIMTSQINAGLYHHAALFVATLARQYSDDLATGVGMVCQQIANRGKERPDFSRFLWKERMLGERAITVAEWELTQNSEERKKPRDQKDLINLIDPYWGTDKGLECLKKDMELVRIELVR